MKILGLDLGSKTLGVAISDELGIIASPVGTFNFKEYQLQEALEYVKILVAKHNIKKIVLGLAKNMDGSIGFQGQYTLKFKDMLIEQLALEVVMVDERLTSRMAEQVMLEADLSRKKRKTKVDQLAATIILQSYLDSIKK